MNKRPVSVTVFAWLFIVAGAIGLAYHGAEFRARGPFRYEVVWVCLFRLIAIVGGVFLLRARNWARWLLLAWMAYHVVLSAFHALTELVMHAILLAVLTWVLFRPAASAYFRSSPRRDPPAA